VRISRIDSGHRLREKILLAMMRRMSKREPPDVVKTLLYRRDFWGDPYNEVIQRVMRGPSDWSVGERELFAAVVSQRVGCVF
jgi:hypothetical protein